MIITNGMVKNLDSFALNKALGKLCRKQLVAKEM